MGNPSDEPTRKVQDKLLADDLDGGGWSEIGTKLRSELNFGERYAYQHVFSGGLYVFQNFTFLQDGNFTAQFTQF